VRIASTERVSGTASTTAGAATVGTTTSAFAAGTLRAFFSAGGATAATGVGTIFLASAGAVFFMFDFTTEAEVDILTRGYDPYLPRLRKPLHSFKIWNRAHATINTMSTVSLC